MVRYENLQIGDYVLLKNNPVRVESITKRKIGYHMCENETSMHYARLMEIFPVEITSKVLLSNGFIMYCDWPYTIVYKYCVENVQDKKSWQYISIEVEINKLSNEVVEISIVSVNERGTCKNKLIPADSKLYMHDLQNALNNCKTNLKIKL